MPNGTLVFDIETHTADLLYTMPSEEFVRLIGYRWRGRKTVLTTDLDEIREQIDRARWIIGHNILAFDLPAVFGHKSNVPLQLANEGRVYDTWTHATLVHPAPFQYTDRNGRVRKITKLDQAKSWFSLDEQAHQLGVPGKTHDLKALAKEFGDPSLPAAARVADGFGKIPVTDERYRDYLCGDVDASENVGRKLLERGPLNDYALREQRIAACAAVISSNGFRVDVEAAQARVDELAQRRETIMAGLVERYGFPTEGKKPWATAAGKAAIVSALAEHGVTEKTRPDWPRTATGALAFGGEVLTSLTKGTPAEETGQALAELMGQRSLAGLALESVHADGFAHPEITTLQKSGRWSTTRPGLTVWTAHGPGAVEKRYFVPDNADEVLIGIDYSNADARAVAAMSGDRKYAERFQPGADGHLINAWIAWGRDVVGDDKKDPTTEHYRELAKPGGHGWGYRIGPRKLAAMWGLPVEEAKSFLDRMNSAFHRVVAWQDRVVALASRHGYVVNEWGRRMPVDRDRAYTQAPALLGQSTTREIVCDALLRMPPKVLRRVKAQIHDELLFSVPRAHAEEWRAYLTDLMSASFSPAGGQKIDFPVGASSPAENWFEAKH